MNEIVLGATYKDMVTGFTGVATSKTQYLFACERVHLEANDGKPADGYYDAPGLQFVTGPKPDVVAAIPAVYTPRTGGDHPAPPSRDVSR